MNQYYNLLVHVDMDDAKVFGLALGNVTNYLNALPDEKYDVIILCNGFSATLLHHESCPHTEGIAALLARGVKFQVCINAVKKAGFTPEELVPGFTVIPAGIVALVELQRQGFAYIKP